MRSGGCVALKKPTEVRSAEFENVRSRCGTDRTLGLSDENVAAMLEEFGYSLIEAGSGSAALDRIRNNRNIDLLLVDFAMPGMNEVEFARATADIRPELPVIFVTGYADLKALHDVGEDRLVRKSCRRRELADKIRSVLPDARTRNVVRLRK